MPELVSGRFSERGVFYSSYLQTYIERDAKEQVALTDTLLFSDFLHSATCRAGQMLNVHDIAQNVGVSRCGWCEERFPMVQFCVGRKLTGFAV